MIIDTSAIMAILLQESGYEVFTGALHRHGGASISCGTLIELTAVLTRGYQGSYDSVAETFLSQFRIDTAPMTQDQARIGRDAYRRYGIGSGHPARLNFGDCFAYALAIERDEPLLFKGEDFIHTDVRRAI